MNDDLLSQLPAVIVESSREQVDALRRVFAEAVEALDKMRRELRAREP